ncbi:MAG: hypothetical protein ACI8TL_001448, partial [Natronomonas sp.]
PTVFVNRQRDTVTVSQRRQRSLLRIVTSTPPRSASPSRVRFKIVGGRFGLRVGFTVAGSGLATQ